ncbi:MAG: hypothetical protein HC883_03010 [Bdellovibrionaceae bacterium]|nr:hypothetical protein [Pseudobdellovibrionaceae bacterium]
MRQLSRVAVSIEDIQKMVSEVVPDGEVSVVPVQYGNREYIRMSTSISYNGDQGIYLTSTGLRQVMAFIEGGQGLGYDGVALAHNGTDDVSSQRIQVVKRFINERYGDRVTVRTMNVDATLALKDGFEIWLGKGKKQ